jgi:ABC-type sulfate/molybdate transport systems ATPase subunit
VLLVTHDIQEARDVADDLVVLDDGRIAQAGTVADVVNAPAGAYVRALLRCDDAA